MRQKKLSNLLNYIIKKFLLRTVRNITNPNICETRDDFKKALLFSK